MRHPILPLLPLLALVLTAAPAAADDAATNAFRRYTDNVEKYGADDARTRTALETLRALQAAAASGTVETAAAVAAPAVASTAGSREVQIAVQVPDRKYASVGVGPCGQFAMGIILGQLGCTVDMDKIFAESNPDGKSFTSPANVQRYMRSQGVETTLNNNSSIEALTAELDAGRPVMCLISTSGTAHWIAVTGYATDASGKVTGIRMSDSYYGNTGPYEMPVDQFLTQWNKPLKEYSILDGKLGLDNLTGYNRLMLTFGGKDSHTPSALDLFGSFSTAAGDAIFGGANSAVVGWNRKDPAQVVGGAVQAIGGLAVQGAFGLPGGLLSTAGNWLKEKGGTLAEQGGIAGVAGTVVSGIGAVVDGAGKIITGAGNVVASGLNAITNGIKSLFGGY